MVNKEQISIYIHVPYCLKKCKYCDFYSIGKKCVSEQEGNEYGFLLAREFELLNEIFPELFSRKLSSIYLGGGTPSILNPKAYNLLFKKIKSFWKDFKEVEITLEVNPETISIQKIKDYISIGINRISLGVQSFSNKNLKKLGRIHSSGKAIESINIIKNFKDFRSLNIDLMFGIPGQTLQSWAQNLDYVITLEPQHLSVYGLTIHPNTPFFNLAEKGKLKLPEEDEQAEMFLLTRNMLQNAGYEHYEISNYAKSGFRSCHNLNYWLGNEYIGLGAGAHSFINNEHYFNPDDLLYYRNKILENSLPQTKDVEISSEQILKEKIMLALRMLDGIDIPDFNKKHNCDIQKDYQIQVKTLKELEMINITGKKIHLTEKGILLADEVTALFF